MMVIFSVVVYHDDNNDDDHVWSDSIAEMIMRMCSEIPGLIFTIYQESEPTYPQHSFILY